MHEKCLCVCVCNWEEALVRAELINETVLCSAILTVVVKQWLGNSTQCIIADPTPSAANKKVILRGLYCVSGASAF